ncbi:hypothetical protein M231_07528 [Tremella mesenterica]|uniref:Uncharacterized protein n=1 Tax=Tremella mesenterica TaxID=5217 RepID=A0A4Q1BE18_TREME|nr:hypothetical protein M231_07528 [Tremella mesenterica]
MSSISQPHQLSSVDDPAKVIDDNWSTQTEVTTTQEDKDEDEEEEEDKCEGDSNGENKGNQCQLQSVIYRVDNGQMVEIIECKFCKRMF